MKLPFAAAASLSLLAASSATPDVYNGRTKKIFPVQDPSFELTRITYDWLLNARGTEGTKTAGNGSGSETAADEILRVLSEVGALSVRDVPGYASAKHKALAALHACIEDDNRPTVVQDHVFPDGTVRKTFATHTVPGPGGQQRIFGRIPQEDIDSIQGELDDIQTTCTTFDDVSFTLRRIIAEATKIFASVLAASLATEMPLLVTPDGSFAFNTISDVVEGGHHLEHFHSYRRTKQNTTNKYGEERLQDMTIEMHTDQGLFIAFTPGLLANDEGSTRHPGESGFYIVLRDGSRAIVKFHEDDLVFLLGDGVNQIVNAKVLTSETHASRLRSVPHALVVPRHESDESRVWYGRMVLPPPGALHPEHDGMTYEDLRRNMIAELLSHSSENQRPTQGNSLSLGCSSSLVARQLEESTCEAGAIFCWHRCMNVTEYAVSDDVCADQNAEMKCINPRDQVYVSGHGDYYPGCTNSTEEATPYPNLPYYPRDEDACTPIDWEEFASGTVSGDDYDHAFEPNEGLARFMWTHLDDGTIKARLAFNGIFGYLAFGLAGNESKSNRMHGAPIVMALAGGNYSARDGLDMTLDPTIGEFRIHPTETAFRHWQEPIVGQQSTMIPFTYKVEKSDCFTAISFQSDSIAGVPFNMSGTDKVLWAANGMDYYAGYHGENRSVFCIDWDGGYGFLESEKGAGCDYTVMPTENTTNGAHIVKTDGKEAGLETKSTSPTRARNSYDIAVVFVAALSAITVFLQAM